MDSRRAPFVVIPMLLACISVVCGQEATPASGGDASSPGGTVTWTIGQVGYISHSNETGFVSPGVQQPFEVITVGSVELSPETTIEFYPNPIQDAFILQIESPLNSWDVDQLLCAIYDLHGKRIRQQVITQSKTTVQMEDLANGVYVVRLSLDQHTIKTFKVFKTN